MTRLEDPAPDGTDNWWTRWKEIVVGTLGEPERSVRQEYQQWLDQIDDELVGAALLVSDAVPRVTRALLAADPACIAEGRSLAADVKERMRVVEDQGFLMLAREAPVAGDLRRLVAALRLVTAVERSAALLRNAAGTLERVDPRQLPPEVREQMDELARHAGEVYRRGVDAWRTRDSLAVHELDEVDAAVDRLAIGLVQRSVELEDASAALVLGLLARYLERIADHGLAFAQHSTFAVTGERPDVGR